MGFWKSFKRLIKVSEKGSQILKEPPSPSGDLAQQSQGEKANPDLNSDIALTEYEIFIQDKNDLKEDFEQNDVVNEIPQPENPTSPSSEEYRLITIEQNIILEALTSNIALDKISLGAIGLNARAIHSLQIGGITDLGQLCKCDWAFLLSLPNLGSGTRSHILDVLEITRLNLKSDLNSDMAANESEIFTQDKNSFEQHSLPMDAINQDQMQSNPNSASYEEHRLNIAEQNLILLAQKSDIELDKISLSAIGLNARAIRALQIGRITNLGQLCKRDRASLLRCHSLGKGTFAHIVTVLEMTLMRLKSNPSYFAVAGYLLENPLQHKAYNFHNDNIRTYLPKEANIAGVHLENIKLTSLELRPDIVTALQFANIDSVERLCRSSSLELLRLPGVGIVGFEHILAKLDEFQTKLTAYSSQASLKTDVEMQYTTDITEIKISIKALCEPFTKAKVAKEILLPTNIQKLLYNLSFNECKTLEDLMNISQNLESVSEFNYWLQQLGNRVSELLSYSNLDAELNSIFSALSTRQKRVFIDRTKFYNPRTLDDLGQEFNVSRERIRQIQEEAQKKITHRAGKLPLLYCTSAILLLIRLGNKATKELWRHDLAEAGFIKEETSLDLLLAIAQNTHIKKLNIDPIFTERLRTNTPKLISIADKRILTTAKKICKNCGAVRVIALQTPDVKYEEVQQSLKNNRFFEIDSGWWSCNEDPVVLHRVANKVITYCGPVLPVNLRRAFERHCIREKYLAPPTEVVVAVLIATGKFVIDNGMLNLKQPLENIPVLSVPESVFLKTIAVDGPIISFDTIYKNIVAEGYSSATVGSLLRHSPIVQRVTGSLYTLLGGMYNQQDIQAAQNQHSRKRLNQTLKLLTDGKAVFETNVNGWFYGGVISSGPASRLKGTWKLNVDSITERTFTIEQYFIRGLAGVAKELGIVSGDRVRFEFNTWNHETTVMKVNNHEKNADSEQT